MKKALVIAFGVIVVLVLATILIWNMLPTIVSHKLSSRAGVSVSISDIRFKPSMISMDRIHVGNPEGYTKTKRALSVEEFIVNVPFSRFFDDNIVIDEMTMDDVYVGLEFNSTKSTDGNWTTIMKNISKSTEDEKKEASQKGKTTKVLIKKLVITDLQIELAYRSGGKPNQKLRKIDRIELTNISSEGGIPTSQIMNIVMQEMLRNIFSKEGLQNMLEGILNPNQSKEGVIDTLKGLFSEAILLDNDWEEDIPKKTQNLVFPCVSITIFDPLCTAPIHLNRSCFEGIKSRALTLAKLQLLSFLGYTWRLEESQ